MRTGKSWLQTLGAYMNRWKIATSETLRRIWGCSQPTVLRRLKRVGYYSSYNFNSTYFTLEGIPQFDRHGLWECRRVRFSQWGTLRETIRHLVDDSQKGLTLGELQDILQTRVSNQVRFFAEEGVLVRMRYAGGSVYYSSGEPRRLVQKDQRERMVKPATQVQWGKDKLLASRQSALWVIEILAAKIAQPEWGVQEVYGTLSGRGIQMPAGVVRAVFEQFGLAKKNSLRPS